MEITELIEKRIDENVASYDLGTLESYKYLIEMIAIEYHNEQLRQYNISGSLPSLDDDVEQSEQLSILDRCGCEEPNEEPIKVCMNCNGYVE